MVEQIARFEYIVTDSELEALVLESNLIKEHCPKYNTMLKGFFNVPKAVNEPVKSYAPGSPERAKVAETYKTMWNSQVEVPLYIW